MSTPGSAQRTQPKKSRAEWAICCHQNHFTRKKKAVGYESRVKILVDARILVQRSTFDVLLYLVQVAHDSTSSVCSSVSHSSVAMGE
jgi:hypothetical protein